MATNLVQQVLPTNNIALRNPENVVVRQVQKPPRKGIPPHIFVLDQWEKFLVHHPPSSSQFPNIKEKHAYEELYSQRRMVYKEIKSIGIDAFEIKYSDFIKPGQYTKLVKEIQKQQPNVANTSVLSMLKSK